MIFFNKYVFISIEHIYQSLFFSQFSDESQFIIMLISDHRDQYDLSRPVTTSQTRPALGHPGNG